ncbi:MAG: LPXTG cell wall anchor domain-containing protein [Acidobacteriaceae bacterium]|nr:LPXTG cell wall anchor domain-containing protein [Acidobacteriaceae bacterium]
MPKTASFNPLVGLLGLASLSLAGLLSFAGKRA